MSWTNDVVLEFLELYRREQHLWDSKHPNHRNRSEITDAWHRIQTSLSVSFSITDLKRKKESLMTSFRMHLGRKKKSLEAYHTTWFAFPLMESFLGGKYECDSTIQMENDFFNNSTSYNSQLIQENNRSLNTFEKNGSNNRSRSTGTQQIVQNKPCTYNNTDMLYSKKQMTDAVTYLKSTTHDKKDMDEYELYGQLLAKKLRKLDERQRDVAMHDIDNIMFRAKMQSQNNNSQNRTCSSPSSPIPRKMKSPIFIDTQTNHISYEDENITYSEDIQQQPPP